MQKFADARAPLFESSGCYELDADMTRMTPMIAAAGCSGFSAITTTEIETPGPSQPRGLLRRVKLPDAKINTPKSHNNPVRNDQTYFVLCPYNVLPLSRERRSRRSSAAAAG